ncbi:Cytochrome P450 4V2 [Chamberlinius hualienensis]|uniref:Cytochrome P450 4GM2 n=1 Tax=Chamberlinius hualienensis TaxID=1551368 RepID=A0A1J1DZ43_9MYRI|nr:cytochrome P450 4GM2 [Chamberlinius hualienensis]
MMITVSCYALILFLLIYIKLKYFKSKFEKMLLKLPGPGYNVFIGNLMRFAVKREELYSVISDLCNEFSNEPVVRVWLGKTPRIFLTKVEAAKVILSDISHDVKGVHYKLLYPWMGDGLLFSTGAKWRERRRMITPTFHFRILEEFRGIMNKQAAILADILTENTNNYFNIHPYITRASLDIICETAMGIQIGSQLEKTSNFLQAVSGMTQCLIQRIFNIWSQIAILFPFSQIARRQHQILEVLHTFTRKIIQERKAELEAKTQIGAKMTMENEFGQKRRLAFLDMLLEAQYEHGSIDDKGIQEEVDTFMFEGHDTTTSGITWTLYNIARFPEFQAKIHEELDQVLGTEEVTEISSQHLSNLKYLECVIKESLRCFPAVPIFSRKLLRDTDICGYTIPSGATVSFLVERIHKDSNHWPEPEKFDPDRFLPENASNRHPYAFIPFSAGHRNCIGQRFAMMELKIIAAYILHRYSLKTETKFETLQPISEFVLRPSNGISIKIQPRRTT